LEPVGYAVAAEDGRPNAAQDATLLADLKRLVKPGHSGRSNAGLRWTLKSLRHQSQQFLQAQGIRFAPM